MRSLTYARASERARARIYFKIVQKYDEEFKIFKIIRKHTYAHDTRLSLLRVVNASLFFSVYLYCSHLFTFHAVIPCSALQWHVGRKREKKSNLNNKNNVIYDIVMWWSVYYSNSFFWCVRPLLFHAFTRFTVFIVVLLYSSHAPYCYPFVWSLVSFFSLLLVI